jgi:hypothetical protein
MSGPAPFPGFQLNLFRDFIQNQLYPRPSNFQKFFRQPLRRRGQYCLENKAVRQLNVILDRTYTAGSELTRLALFHMVHPGTPSYRRAILTAEEMSVQWKHTVMQYQTHGLRH